MSFAWLGQMNEHTMGTMPASGDEAAMWACLTNDADPKKNDRLTAFPRNA